MAGETRLLGDWRALFRETQPGGKVNQVLTDQEIAALWGRLRVPFAPMIGDSDAHGLARFARAVEAAVLAKVRAERDFLPPTERKAQAAYLNAKWEREARKRVLMGQREAWDACYAFITALAGRGLLGSRYDYPDKERDRRYPLPTRRVPRTVVLSDGLRIYARELSGVTLFHHDHTLEGVAPECADFQCTESHTSVYRLAKTPADARLLADLVERPYDEVPDDD